MKTRKIAVTIPENLIAVIDGLSVKIGVSRSKYITSALYEKVVAEERKNIKEAYDAVFSDETVCREQLETAAWFTEGNTEEGQEW